MCCHHLQVDGILFYNKRAVYIPGESKDVLWLKPYMLPEVFSVGVPPNYSTKPPNYVSFDKHAAKIKEENEDNTEEKPKQRNQKQQQIDIDTITGAISEMYIEKNEKEKRIGPALNPQASGRASVWQRERNDIRERPDLKPKGTYFFKEGILGNPWDHYGNRGNTGYDGYGNIGYDGYGNTGYDGYGNMGYGDQQQRDKWNQSHRFGNGGYSNYDVCDQSLRQYGGYNSQDYSQQYNAASRKGMPGAWGFEEHKRARENQKPKGRGAQLSTMASYKSTLNAFSK